MKRLILVGLLLAGCTQPPQPPPGTPTPSPTTVSTPTPAAGWHPFTAPDGSFTALLPGTVDLQEEEDGFEVLARAEPGTTVEIDVDRFSTAKTAARAHDEKVKNAPSGGQVKARKQEGGRVVLTLEHPQKGQFFNILILSDNRVLDIIVIGDDRDLQTLLDSLKLKS